MRKLFLLLAQVFVSPVIAFANGNDGRHMDDCGHIMDFGYGGMFMWAISLIFIGVVIYLIIQGTKSKTPDGESPMDILKRRYAKGEITKEEFDKMKRDL